MANQSVGLKTTIVYNTNFSPGARNRSRATALSYDSELDIYDGSRGGMNGSQTPLSFTYDEESLYDDPYLIINPFNQVLGLYASIVEDSNIEKSIQLGSRIRATNNKSLTAKAFVYQTYSQTFSSLAYILSNRTISILGSIYFNPTKTIGIKGATLNAVAGSYYIYDSTDLLYDSPGVINNRSIFAELSAKAFITGAPVFKSVLARAYVYANPTKTTEAKAYLVYKSFISAKASLVYNRTSTIQVKAAIQKTQSLVTSAKARISNLSTNTVSAKAKIVKLVTITAQARLIAKPLSLLSSQSKISKRYSNTSSIRANINYRQNMTSKATIRATSYSTFSASSRIINTLLTSIQVEAYIIKLQAVEAKARILNTSNAYISARKTIIARVNRYLPIKARLISTLQGITILSNITHDLFIRARISQRQGFPVPAFDDGNYSIFTATQLTSRTRIQGAQRSTQKVDIGSNINWKRSKSFQARTNIITASNVAIRANITSFSKSVSLIGTFNVREHGTGGVRMIYYVNKPYRANQLSIGAYIVQNKTVTLKGSFLVQEDLSYAEEVHTFSMNTKYTPSKFISLGARIS